MWHISPAPRLQLSGFIGLWSALIDGAPATPVHKRCITLWRWLSTPARSALSKHGRDRGSGSPTRSLSLCFNTRWCDCRHAPLSRWRGPLVVAVAAIWNRQFKGRRHLTNNLQLSVCSACVIWWIRDVETLSTIHPGFKTALTRARWDPGERVVYLLLQKTCLVYSLGGLGHPSRRLSGAFCSKFYARVALADNRTR